MGPEQPVEAAAVTSPVHFGSCEPTKTSSLLQRWKERRAWSPDCLACVAFILPTGPWLVVVLAQRWGVSSFQQGGATQVSCASLDLAVVARCVLLAGKQLT